MEESTPSAADRAGHVDQLGRHCEALLETCRELCEESRRVRALAAEQRAGG